MTRYGKLTREEALSTVADMSEARRLRFGRFHDAFRQALAERADPHAPVSPKRVLELVPSKSSSTYYLVLPLMEAIEGIVDEHEDQKTAEAADYHPSSAISEIFAPLKTQLEVIAHAAERLLASNAADEAKRVRESFAQERFLLQKASGVAKARIMELEAAVQEVAGESDGLENQLEAANSEKVAIEEQLATVVERLNRANVEIKDRDVRLEVVEARLAGQSDSGMLRERELEGILAERDGLLQRLKQAEEDAREQRDLREEERERSNAAFADLQARHATKVAALREEFARSVADERDRVSQLELALVSALKTAIDSTFNPEAEAV